MSTSQPNSLLPEKMAQRPAAGAERMVLIATGGLGDTILFSPVFRAARQVFPRAEIILVTASPLARGLYSSAAELDRIEIIDTNRKFSLALYTRLWRFGAACRRGKGIDIMVCASRLSPWLVRLFKVVCRPRNVMARSFPPEDATDMEVNTALAHQLAPGHPAPSVFVPVTAVASVQAQAILRRKYGIEEPGRLIAVYPSVMKRHHPCWSLHQLIVVASRIAQLIKGRVVIIGGVIEGRQARAVCSGDKGILNLAGVLTVPETAALLGQVRLALCNDGGIMHLAGAVGCPTVAIMSGVLSYYRPPGKFVRVITPRTREGRPMGLESIAEETVYQAATELLNATTGFAKDDMGKI